MSAPIGTESGPGSFDGAKVVIQDHELLRPIGKGSYGEVWLARNVMGGFRAVKLIYRNRFIDDARPFEREYEGIKNFEPFSRGHPGFVDILQVGRDDEGGRIYYVMELADDVDSNVGTNEEAHPINPATYKPKTLRSLLHLKPEIGDLAKPDERCALPIDQCLEIGRELCAALSHLHKQKLVHRDIKPSNIVFVNGSPALADVGLVTAAGENRSYVGTEGFVAPEGPGTRQADVYSLGMVLYEMLTGFSNADFPKFPDSWNEAAEVDLLLETNAVVQRACEQDAKRRYESAAKLGSDLDSLINGRSLVIKNLQRAIHQQRWVIAAIFGISLFAVAVTGFWVFRDRAELESRRRELQSVQLSLLALRFDGWSSNAWFRLEKVAAIRKDKELVEQASAVLTGLDARPAAVFHRLESTSAAFAPNGRLLLSGAGTNCAVLIEVDGRKAELPTFGEGPVCWSTNLEPLQLVVLNRKLVLRNALTGARKSELPAGGFPELEKDPVRAVSQDGELVAASSGGQVYAWRADTGQLLGEASVAATGLAFSPDGKLLAAGAGNGTTSIYRLPGMNQFAVLPPALRGNPILGLAFARNRTLRYDSSKSESSWLLATGDQGAGIVIWDLDRKAPRSYCRGSTWIVTAVAFSPDGLILASSGRNQPRLWDVATGQPLLQLSETSSGAAFALAFDQSGRRLATGGLAETGQATTAIWELEPNRGMQAYRGLSAPVRKVWFSSTGDRVAALSDDWHVGIWDITSKQLVYCLETPVGVSADNAAGAFDRKSKRFAFSAWNEACLYDLTKGEAIRRWQLRNGLSDQLEFDSQDRLLLLRRERSAVSRRLMWRLAELGQAAAPVPVHEQSETNWAAFDMALMPSAERFFVWNGGPDSPSVVLRAIDTRSGKEIWSERTGKTSGTFRLYSDPTGTYVGYSSASVPLEGLHLLRLADFCSIGATPPGYQAIGPSGRQFAGNGWFYPDLNGEPNGLPIMTDRHGGSCPPVFSPDGKLLAWGTEDGILIVVDLETVRRRIRLLLKVNQ